MALITCIDCGKLVSDRAICPNCGCPKNVILKAKAFKNEASILEDYTKGISDYNNELRKIREKEESSSSYHTKVDFGKKEFKSSQNPPSNQIKSPSFIKENKPNSGKTFIWVCAIILLFGLIMQSCGGKSSGHDYSTEIQICNNLGYHWDVWSATCKY